MTVRVVTDSTVDLPQEIADELNITVVPLSVIIEGTPFKEGIEISHAQFYEKLGQSSILPTTSAPSIGDFQSTYSSLLRNNSSIISIHLSSKLSATYTNAIQAVKKLSKDGSLIRVVDSQTTSMAMGFIVTAAARAARDGAKLEEIAELVSRLTPKVHLVFTLNTLEYVRLGGRIGRASAFLGTVLSVKPILSLHNGEVQPEERVRTRAKAIERVIQLMTRYPDPAEMAVGYSTNKTEAETLRLRLTAYRPKIKVSLTNIGPVIGTHTGPGVLGAGLIEGGA